MSFLIAADRLARHSSSSLVERPSRTIRLLQRKSRLTFKRFIFVLCVAEIRTNVTIESSSRRYREKHGWITGGSMVPVGNFLSVYPNRRKNEKQKSIYGFVISIALVRSIFSRRAATIGRRARGEDSSKWKRNRPRAGRAILSNRLAPCVDPRSPISNPRTSFPALSPESGKCH